MAIMDNGRLFKLVAARRHSVTGTGQEIRKRAKLTRPDVAGAVGVEPITIYRWERALRVPRGEPAIRWAELLETLEQENAEIG